MSKNRYTPAERDFIVNNYRYLTTDQIANHLGRSIDGVQQWKSKYKLHTSIKHSEEAPLSVLTIMQSLINLCETTTSPILKEAAKRKLFQLSEIPNSNPYGIDHIGRYFKNS
ncbi:MAG: hypothetical protein EOO20_01750 [Chryseobacterium sp.]|nr:MAG: hypothetical protein EOO20_01750 [Chryseobacterium sp.]